jgi:glutamate transport system ATP-binding protein
MTAEALIELDGVNKWFGKLHVLRDVNLTVARGEVVVVIGPGSGSRSPAVRRSS